MADGAAGTAEPSGRVVHGRRLGGMVPESASRPAIEPPALVRADARPQSAFRDDLRRIPSWRNAWSVAFVWLQTVAIVALAVWWANPVGYALAFLLMGRACAQLASLMHESAHRLLFANRAVNDWVGRWLCGYPIFTSTDAYRRVHMAHHRHEFGPDEPDIRCTPTTRSPTRASVASSCATRRVAPACGCSATRRRDSARPTRACDTRSGRSCWCRPCCSAPRSPSVVGGSTRCCGCCRT